MDRPGIYVKLATGWIRIKEKIARPRATRKGGKALAKATPVYSMVGESLDDTPKGGRLVGEFYVSAFKVSKYIMRIIDVVDEKAVVVIEPTTRETYRVRVYDSNGDLLEELKRIAVEVKAFRTRVAKQKSSEASEKSSS